MDFQQAESKFKQLKAQFGAGELTEAEFKTQLEELMVQDETGSWWMIGYETERWFRHDGENWVQADPPGSPSLIQKPTKSAKSEATESKSLDKVNQEIAEKAAEENAERDISEEKAKEKTHGEVAEKILSNQVDLQPATKHTSDTKLSKRILSSWITYVMIGVIAVIFLITVGVWVSRSKNPQAALEVPPEEPAEQPVSEEPIPAITESENMPPQNPSNGNSMISEKDDMVMVYVPAGEFLMGNKNGDQNETPVHNVYLDGFWIDQTEVTNEMFAAFLNAEGNQSEGSITLFFVESDEVPIRNVENIWMVDLGYEDHPVVNVSWNGALAYCEWTYSRLPTEAEWEKAARGGLEGKWYPWGNDKPVCNTGAYNGAQTRICQGNTAPVGSFGKNGFGLYDMAGNVWEWVSSLYRPYPYDATDGRENLSTYGDRVKRGGSWTGVGYILSGQINISHRGYTSAINVDNETGFRCARDAK